MTDTEAETPLTTCGHPFPCVPSDDGQCDHVDGNGVHQGYAYRCLLVPHGNTRHFHDRRPVAREWFERSTGTHAVLADAARSRPATDPASCGYECPFTREGHAAHEVDHEFEPRPATDPAGLDALITEFHDQRWGHDEGECLAKKWMREFAVRLSVADGPGPEERLRERIEAVIATWEREPVWTRADVARGLRDALSRPLPEHREEPSR